MEVNINDVFLENSVPLIKMIQPEFFDKELVPHRKIIAMFKNDRMLYSYLDQTKCHPYILARLHLEDPNFTNFCMDEKVAPWLSHFTGINRKV